MRADRFVELVERAFADTRLPPAPAMTHDHCDECTSTYQTFWAVPGEFAPWQEVARRPGTNVESALLTPDAWRYYLPALLVWCVRDEQRVAPLDEFLVYQLTPPASPHAGWIGARAHGFTPAQRGAVAAYLEWYAARERAQAAEAGFEGWVHEELSEAIRWWKSEC